MVSLDVKGALPTSFVATPPTGRPYLHRSWQPRELSTSQPGPDSRGLFARLYAKIWGAHQGHFLQKRGVDGSL